MSKKRTPTIEPHILQQEDLLKKADRLIKEARQLLGLYPGKQLEFDFDDKKDRSQGSKDLA